METSGKASDLQGKLSQQNLLTPYILKKNFFSISHSHYQKSFLVHMYFPKNYELESEAGKTKSLIC